MISASEWNALIDEIARWTPLGFTPADASSEWSHPWHTTTRWNPVYVNEDGKPGRFEATVNPGFVNGRDVFVGVPPSGGQESARSLPLTDYPSFPLSSFRHIGGSGSITLDSAGEPVPEFFAALGVRGGTTITADSLELGTPTDITAEKLATADPTTAPVQLPERQLKACDIVLRCARARTVIDWTITPAETGSIATFNVASSPLPVSSSPSLHVQTLFSPLATPTTADRLSGDYNDPGYEETKVCTVYLLSPPDAALDAEPDETWTPYTRHELFWNAKFEVTQPVASNVQPLAVNLAGLGGNAQINVNQLLSTNNDAFAAVMQFISAREITAKITTPGHRTPPKWDKTLSLDPPFPFKGLQ